MQNELLFMITLAIPPLLLAYINIEIVIGIRPASYIAESNRYRILWNITSCRNNITSQGDAFLILFLYKSKNPPTHRNLINHWTDTNETAPNATKKQFWPIQSDTWFWPIKQRNFVKFYIYYIQGVSKIGRQTSCMRSTHNN